MQPAARVIDDLSRDDLVATIGTRWQLVTDRVMGGVSDGTLVRESVSGRPALRMRGDVSLENNGGFVQMALDFAPDGSVVDASAWAGIELDVIGNNEEYGIHLRTDAVERPWQSYRQSFRAGASWRTVQLAFADFVPHRIDVPLDVRRLRRIGLVAIGRAFTADLAVGGVRFYG
jgi:Complex I intermediate-associated protein 30 (CIA30)